MDSPSFASLKESFLSVVEFVNNRARKLFIIPFVGRSKNIIRCFKLVRILLCITIGQMTAALISSKLEDYFVIIDIAPNLGVCVLIVIKYTKIHANQNIYDNFLKHFTVDFWNIIEPENKKHVTILEKYTRITNTLVHLQCYYMHGVVAIIVIFPRIMMLCDTKILGNDIKYLYPFDGWYPFDKVKWYNLVYIWESLMTAIVVILFGTADMIHLSFIRHVCMELKILGSTTRELIRPEDCRHKKQLLTKEGHDIVKKKLRLVIKRHQKLIRYELI